MAIVVMEADYTDLPRRLLVSHREVLAMRRELACALPRLLWSGIFGSFLGEGFAQDGFETLLQIVSGAAPLTSACGATELEFVDMLLERSNETLRRRLQANMTICRAPNAENHVGNLCFPGGGGSSRSMSLRPWPAGGAVCFGSPNDLCNRVAARTSTLTTDDTTSSLSSAAADDTTSSLSSAAADDTAAGDVSTTPDTTASDVSAAPDTTASDVSTAPDTVAGDVSTTPYTAIGDVSTVPDTAASDVSTTPDTA
ncbi:hypothetical protein CYMTET_30941, partial [Cymbomonas tetramitiformis]